MNRPLFTLLLGFSLAICSFFASTVYSQYASGAIDEVSSSIFRNAAPSVERLSNARTDLVSLRTAMRRLLMEPGKQSSDEVVAARQRLDTRLQSYLALPFFRDEQSLWRDARERLVDVDQFVATFSSQRPLGPGDPLRLLLREIDAVDGVDDALRALVTFNARQAADGAARITALRLRRERVELALDACSAILTILVALLAIRAMRHFARVLEERNRLQTMRAEELELFAGRVAHDVRGPLSTTSMAIQLCTSKVESERALELLERGARGVTRVETIVDGLLRFARAAAQPEPGVQTALAPVVEEIVSELQPVAAEQQIELRAEPLPNDRVACNAGVLSSVIENLARNAIKYMGDAPARTIVLRALVRGERVRFEVRDTGPGIPPETLPRIFEPYVRGHTNGQPGIGLGLATVRRIVEAHGGEVRVQSSQRGSLFSFDLPRAVT